MGPSTITSKNNVFLTDIQNFLMFLSVVTTKTVQYGSGKDRNIKITIFMDLSPCEAVSRSASKELPNIL
jgi:hypothetical protein